MNRLTSEEIYNLIRRNGYEDLAEVVKLKKVTGRQMLEYTEYEWGNLTDRTAVKRIWPQIAQFKENFAKNSQTKLAIKTVKPINTNLLKTKPAVESRAIGNDKNVIPELVKENNVQRSKTKLDILVEQLKQRQVHSETSSNPTVDENMYGNVPIASHTLNDNNSKETCLPVSLTPESSYMRSNDSNAEIRKAKPVPPIRNSNSSTENAHSIETGTVKKMAKTIKFNPPKMLLQEIVPEDNTHTHSETSSSPIVDENIYGNVPIASHTLNDNYSKETCVPVSLTPESSYRRHNDSNVKIREAKPIPPIRNSNFSTENAHSIEAGTVKKMAKTIKFNPPKMLPQEIVPEDNTHTHSETSSSPTVDENMYGNVPIASHTLNDNNSKETCVPVSLTPESSYRRNNVKITETKPIPPFTNSNFSTDSIETGTVKKMAKTIKFNPPPHLIQKILPQEIVPEDEYADVEDLPESMYEPEPNFRFKQNVPLPLNTIVNGNKTINSRPLPKPPSLNLKSSNSSSKNETKQFDKCSPLPMPPKKMVVPVLETLNSCGDNTTNARGTDIPSNTTEDVPIRLKNLENRLTQRRTQLATVQENIYSKSPQSNYKSTDIHIVKRTEDKSTSKNNVAQHLTHSVSTNNQLRSEVGTGKKNAKITKFNPLSKLKSTGNKSHSQKNVRKDMVDQKIDTEYDDEGYLAPSLCQPERPISNIGSSKVLPKLKLNADRNTEKNHSIISRPLPTPPSSDQFTSLRKPKMKEVDKFASLPMPPKKMVAPAIKNVPNTSLETESYYRNTDAKGAEMLLDSLPIGAFILRPSRKFEYTLSVKDSVKVYNFGISKENNSYKLNCKTGSKPIYFTTIQDMIKFHLEVPVIVEHEHDVKELYIKNLIPSDMN